MIEKTLTDGGKLIAIGAIFAGVNFFAGYPITPASGILKEMTDCGVGISVSDEISALQYLTGASLNGLKAMTATSAPGYLLMTEGIGAAFAMEAPLTIILVQRLGPATGSATSNAQGDILLSGNIISGGYIIPVLCPSRIEDCLELTIHAINISELLRTPAVLLTEKDMVTGKRTVLINDLVYPDVKERAYYNGEIINFKTYGNVNEMEVPPFRPLGDDDCIIRINASTHDENGRICKFSEDLRYATERLNISEKSYSFPLSVQDIDGASDLIISFGCTSYAASEAVKRIRAKGGKVSHVKVRTLFPVLKEDLISSFSGVKRIIIPEENHTGQYRKILLGEEVFKGFEIQNIIGINTTGRAIAPGEIEEVVLNANS